MPDTEQQYEPPALSGGLFSRCKGMWRWIPREWKTSALIVMIETSYLMLQIWAALHGH